MIHLFNIEEWAEKHFDNQLSPSEINTLMEAIAKDSALKKEYEQTISILTTMQQLKDHTEFKASVAAAANDMNNTIEMPVENEPFVPTTTKAKIIAFTQKYAKQAAVAASLVLCSSLITYNIAVNRGGETKSQYTLLKRDIENIKRSQNKIINNINTNKQQVDISNANFGGSGFSISNNGLIATNYHVVADAESIYVQNSKGENFKADLISSDPSSDIAILKVSDSSFINRNIALPYSFSNASPSLGQKVFTIGYPKDEVVYNEGYISSEKGYNSDTTSYQLEIVANPGQSGAPVLDTKGNVVALITAKQKNTSGTTYAVHSDKLIALMESLSKEENITISNKKSPLYGAPRVDQVKAIRDYVYSIKVYNNK